jgi:hypothetical protein
VPLRASDLVDLAKTVASACDAGDIAWKYAFAGKKVRFDPNEPPSLLNSFFHDDIKDAISLLEQDRLPEVVSTIFDPSAKKHDVFRDEADQAALLRAGTITRSAWPSRKSLALMQQAAIRAAHSSDARAMVSVNGPPGTGKTTLLRSFIAENIVKRAERLVEIDNPSDAWTIIEARGESQSAVYTLAPALTGFEMVVASNNNGAIENITNDIPLESTVSGYEAVLAEIDQFSSVALNIANHRRTSQNEIKKTWGLIAAALGAKKKRQAFVEPFLMTASPEITAGVQTLHEFIDTRPCTDWEAARTAFRSSHEKLLMHIAGLPERDVAWSLLPTKDRQLSTPFIDATIERMQIDVFVRALVLHRCFVQSSWTEISANLTAWSSLVMRPWLASDLGCETATAVWKSFFLICPVLSTTFASARRMLEGVVWSSLGWALIDEAGQATPQSALGVLLRCKRAIVVGDPLQLEPIVSLSSSIVRLVEKTYGANSSFITSDNGVSLQTVADRCSVHGTTRQVTGPDKSVRNEWIGIPLVVHRRCLEPMFSMSNQIYGQDMISSVDEPDGLHERHPFGESVWIETFGAAHPHAVREQIDLVTKMVLRLFGYYRKRYRELESTLSPNANIEEVRRILDPWSTPSLSVIAPFRQVEEQLQERLSEFRGLGKWAELHVGTIHKFQGKESEAVIVVLGLDEKTKGAASFATSKPNMMNVAVTRAKHRLYVVGSSAVWGDTPYFGDIYAEFKDNSAFKTELEFRAVIDERAPHFPAFEPALKAGKKNKSGRRPKAAPVGITQLLGG